MSEPAKELDFGLDFKSAPERLVGERDERLAMSKRMLHYEVSFLDDILVGIMPHDLILLGAYTGAGKTALASHIAKKNAGRGRRVAYFALEGEPKEIERRIKYSFVIWQARSDGLGNHLRGISYRRWYACLYDDVVGYLDEWAQRQVEEFLGSMSTYYRGSDFTSDDLERLFFAIQDQTDLIILDHLHYIDTDDSNENRAYKRIIKAIRNASLSIGVPVLCLAHLRKQDRKNQQAVPGLDEFHGSSDIVKIATQVITLARAEDRESSRPYISNTYMHVAKDRMDGATRFAAEIGFDVVSKFYADKYRLGRLAPGNASWEPVDRDTHPAWAKNAI